MFIIVFHKVLQKAIFWRMWSAHDIVGKKHTHIYIYILNQWGQLLRNLVIRAFSMQKITTIQPSMFGQTWKQFQCISMTNRHTKKKLSPDGNSLWSQGSEQGNKLKRAKTWRMQLKNSGLDSASLFGHNNFGILRAGSPMQSRSSLLNVFQQNEC